MSEQDPTRPVRPARPGREAGPDNVGRGPTGSTPGTDPAQDSRAEQVLSQALRVMAGGGKPPTDSEPVATTHRFGRLSTVQLILLAIIIGLLVGVAAGFISVL